MYAKLKPLSPRKPTRGGGGGGGGGEGGEDNGRRMTRTEQLAIEKAAAWSRAIANETLESIDTFEASIHTRATLPTNLGETRPLSTGSIPQDKNHTSPLRMVRCNISLEVEVFVEMWELSACYMIYAFSVKTPRQLQCIPIMVHRCIVHVFLHSLENFFSCISPLRLLPLVPQWSTSLRSGREHKMDPLPGRYEL